MTRQKSNSVGRGPFQPSSDAVFPYIILDGETQYHAPGNIFVTALYVNMLKYTFIPAMLAHIVKF